MKKNITNLFPMFVRIFIFTISINVYAEPEQSVGSFDFSKWKITFPVSKKDYNSSNDSDSALEILNPEFKSWQKDLKNIPPVLKQYFYKKDSNWLFYTPYTGVTTSGNTKYSRTELREMDGSDPNDWTLNAGGSLEGRLKVHSLKGGANKIIFMQIHGKAPCSKPLLKCLWEKNRIRLLTKNGPKLKDFKRKNSYGSINENTWFDFKISVDSDSIKIYLNDDLIEEYGSDILNNWPKNNTYYFKAGNYLQNKTIGASSVVEYSKIILKH